MPLLSCSLPDLSTAEEAGDGSCLLCVKRGDGETKGKEPFVADETQSVAVLNNVTIY